MSQLNRILASKALPVALIILLHVIAYRHFILPIADGWPLFTIRADFSYAYFPWFVYLSDVIKSGQWPLWCPYVATGTPFFINPVSSLYSPITLAIATTTGYSLWIAQFQYIATITVGALGVYLLAGTIGASRWGCFLGAICYGLSSAVYGNLEHGVILNGAALMPWMFWLLYRLLWLDDRRAAGWLSLVYYLLITTAYQPQVVHIVVWMGLYAAYLTWRGELPWARKWRGLTTMVTAGLLALAVATVYWLPILAFKDEFTRGKALPMETALHGGNLHLRHYWGLLFNFMANFPPPGWNPDISMTGVYLGALALPLIAVAIFYRKDMWTWPLLLMAIWCGGMALGEQFPPRVWLHHVLPVMNFARYPSADSRSIFALAMVLMAARGWTVLEEGDRRARWLAIAGMALVVYGLAIGWMVWPGRYAQAQFQEVKVSFVFQTIYAVAALVLLAFARRPAARAGFLLLVAADLLVGVRANVFVGAWLPPPGYFAAIAAEHRSDFPVATALVPRVKPDDLTPTPGNGIDNPKASAGLRTKQFYVGDYNPQRTVRFDAMLAQGLEPYLEKGPRVSVWAGDRPPAEARAFMANQRPASFTIERYGPNDVTYQVKQAPTGWLVFNEMYFPGWRARVDGQDMPMEPVLQGLRALKVGAGDHHIETYFHPDLFFKSLAVTSGALVLWLVWLAWIQRRPGSQT